MTRLRCSLPEGSLVLDAASGRHKKRTVIGIQLLIRHPCIGSVMLPQPPSTGLGQHTEA